MNSASQITNVAGDKDSFARGLGFESYLAMFEASTPVASAQGTPWMVTARRKGTWVAWNEGNLKAYREFESRDEALAFVTASHEIH